MLCVFCLDQTEYILNLFVQSLGYYFQHLLQLGWHTDAFEQVGPSHGSEDRNRHIPENYDQTDGPSEWIHTWTMFYWGWWISFTPFCGNQTLKFLCNENSNYFNRMWDADYPIIFFYSNVSCQNI